MDIVKKLEIYLQKNQTVVHNTNRNGFDICDDIKIAIEEIKQLRNITNRCSEQEKDGAYICSECGYNWG